MAAAELKKAIENLTCPVCYGVFRKPKFLPCHHSYCEQCLDKMQVESKIKCPECRKEATVPSGGVKELANNFFVNRLVDELILQSKVNGGANVSCDKCEEDDPAVTYCPECAFFLCNVCNEAHKRDKTSRSHGVVPFGEMESVPVQSKPKIPMCKEHNNELKFYCETCKELVCLYCTIKDHVGHDHDTVKLKANKYIPELKEINNSIEKMIEELNNAHNSIYKVRCDIKQQREEVYKEIDQYYSEIINKLMEQKKQTVKQLDDIKSQEDKQLETLQEEVEHVKAKAINVKQFNNTVLESSHPELLSMTPQVTTHLQELIDKCHKATDIPAQLLETSIVRFVPTEKPMPQFGHIYITPNLDATEVLDLPKRVQKNQTVTITIVIRYGNSICYPYGGNEVDIKLESIMGDITVGKVKDNQDGSYTVSFTPQQLGMTKLLISIDGQPMKTGVCTFTVYNNYEAMEKPDKIINLDGSIGEPWGIAFSNNNKWAVTDCTKHHVYIFDASQDDQLVSTIGSKGTNNGQFKNPRGVTFDSNNFLYVADHDNHRVQKFDRDGNYSLQFGSKGSNNGHLNGMKGIIAHNGKVYVVEHSNKRISVFTTDGQFSHHIGKEQLNDPYSIAVNMNNALLVADNGHHCIYTFTTDGRYLHKQEVQGSSRNQLHLYSPVGLTTDACGFTLVTCNEGHHMLIYDKKGNFVHSFGSKGSSSGHFCFPRQIAVSSSGYVYICDRNNGRIQIFFCS